MSNFVTHFHTTLYLADANTHKLWEFSARCFRYLTIILFLSATSMLGACADMPKIRIEVGTFATVPVRHEGFIVAGEPQAALVAHNILQEGGNAIDAAVALGFSLAVTLPSSAGLGGNGACIVHDLSAGSAETLDFLLRRNSPSLVSGLFSLHAKYGSLPWSQIISPAENMARFGHLVSRALARDLKLYGSKLFNDRMAIELFMTANRNMLEAGDQMRQPLLASTLGEIRANLPYNSRYIQLEDDMVISTDKAGRSEMDNEPEAQVPIWTLVDGRRDNGIQAFSFESKTDETNVVELVVSESTEYIVADGKGTTVLCILTMGSPFGRGLISRKQGFLIAAKKADGHSHYPNFSMSVLVDLRERHLSFAAASFGTGAGVKVSQAIDGLKNNRLSPDEGSSYSNLGEYERGDISMAYCDKRIPKDRVSCQAWARSTGYGYAVVVDTVK